MAVLPPDPVYCFKGDMGHVHSVLFPKSSDGVTNTLLASTESGQVYFWNLETNQLKHKLAVGESVQAILEAGEGLVTQEKRGVLKLWRARNATDYVCERQLECAGGYCRSVLVDGRLLVPRDDSSVDVVDARTFERLGTLRPEVERPGQLMCVQPVEVARGHFLLAGYESGHIVLWELGDALGDGRARARLQLRQFVTSVAFDRGSARGVCAGAASALQVFTVADDLAIRLKCEMAVASAGCSVVRLRPDRRILVSGGWDGRLRLFSWKSLRPLAVLTEHRAAIADVAFSPAPAVQWAANVMAAAGADGIVSLWDLYN